MENYINAIGNLVEKKKFEISSKKWNEISDTFKIWRNDSKNCELQSHFTGNAFGIYFAKELHLNRVDYFHGILKEMESDTRIKSVIENGRYILNIGCSSGPELFAYANYLSELSSKVVILNIKCIDQNDYWKEFIDLIPSLHDQFHVTFECQQNFIEYVEKIKLSDVCIVSNPAFVSNFQDVWETLKVKFSLIIVLDDRSTALYGTLKSYGYQMKEFNFRGIMRFFYYFDDKCTGVCRNRLHKIYTGTSKSYTGQRNSNHSVNYHGDNHDNLSNAVCSQILESTCDSRTLKILEPYGGDIECREKVSVDLRCGHTREMMCCDVKWKKEEFERKACVNKLHSQLTPCDEDPICNEMLSVPLSCGHIQKVACNDLINQNIKLLQCIEMVKKMCNHQLHEYLVACKDKEQVVCKKKCLRQLPCGHSKEAVCDKMNEIVRERCTQLIVRDCANGYHKQTIECSGRITCKKKIKINLRCGHSRILECAKVNLIEGETFICTKISCRSKPVINKITSVSVHNQLEYPISGSICGHQVNGICFELCNKLLPCGHLCQRFCRECLNGRLHGKCLLICPKILSCGHKCHLYCHERKCQCEENCDAFIKSQNFVPKFVTSDFYKEKWSNLLLQLHTDASEEIKVLLKRIINEVQNKRLTENMKKNCKLAFKHYDEILTLYNDACQMRLLPDSLSQYVYDVKDSVMCLLKFINPLENSVDQLDLTEFKMEFKRIGIIISACKRLNRQMNPFNRIFYENYLKCLIKLKLTENTLPNWEWLSDVP